jgi:hypothetical protein
MQGMRLVEDAFGVLRVQGIGLWWLGWKEIEGGVELCLQPAMVIAAARARMCGRRGQGGVARATDDRPGAAGTERDGEGHRMGKGAEPGATFAERDAELVGLQFLGFFFKILPIFLVLHSLLEMLLDLTVALM